MRKAVSLKPKPSGRSSASSPTSNVVALDFYPELMVRTLDFLRCSQGSLCGNDEPVLHRR